MNEDVGACPESEADGKPASARVQSPGYKVFHHPLETLSTLDPLSGKCAPVPDFPKVTPKLKMHFFFFFFVFFRASPMAYGSSQARGQIGAASGGQCYSYSNLASEPCL